MVDIALAIYPDLSIGENGLLVTWQNRDIFYTIGYSTSEDGSSWSTPEYLYTDNLDDVYRPASTVKGDSIFITYFSLQDDSTGMKPIRFFCSYNYGLLWNDETTLGYPLTAPQDILLKYCQGVLLAAWAGVLDSAHTNQYHIAGYRSEDAGETWSDMIWISPEHEYTAQAPCLSCNEATGQFAVGYMDYRYQEYAFYGDIFIAISNDGGLTWPSEIRPTTRPTASVSSIDFIADTVLVSWTDRRYTNNDNNREIMFNRSNDVGLSWEGETRLTYNIEFSTESWLSYSNGYIHLLWRNDNFNNEGFDIYYKHYDPDYVAIHSNDNFNEIKSFILTAYPNPFNSSLSIKVQSLESGFIQIYDILGKLIKEYNFIQGISIINWDACDNEGKQVSSGVYFIKQKGGNNNQAAQKVIYLH